MTWGWIPLGLSSLALAMAVKTEFMVRRYERERRDR